MSEKTCTEDGCDKAMWARGWCSMHYSRWYRNNSDPVYDTCPSPDCGRNKLVAAPVCKRCNQFRWRYSLTVERVFELFNDYRCNNPGCGVTTRLHLDHDHSCCPDGKFKTSHKKSCGQCVRAWLYMGCNMALGSLQENPARMQGLLAYWESYAASRR